MTNFIPAVAVRLAIALVGASHAIACSGVRGSQTGGMPREDAGTARIADATADANTMQESDGESAVRLAIEGKIQGTPILPVSAHAGSVGFWGNAFVNLTTRHLEIAITDFDADCTDSSVKGRILSIDLFQNPSLPDSTVTRPAEFSVWFPTAGTTELPSDNVAAIAFSGTDPDKTTHIFFAQSGTVHVTRVSNLEIAGTFDARIFGDMLHGSFSAALCEHWLRSVALP